MLAKCFRHRHGKEEANRQAQPEWRQERSVSTSESDIDSKRGISGTLSCGPVGSLSFTTDVHSVQHQARNKDVQAILRNNPRLIQ